MESATDSASVRLSSTCSRIVQISARFLALAAASKASDDSGFEQALVKAHATEALGYVHKSLSAFAGAHSPRRALTWSRRDHTG